MASQPHIKPANNDPLAEAREIGRVLGALNERFEALHPHDILASAFEEQLFGEVAVVSSFGAESAVLLHLVAQVRPETPVIVIDTLKLFGETLQYRTQLQHALGLEDVRVYTPRRETLRTEDPLDTLSGTNPDRCCHIRKTEVLDRALKPFNTWINGRKRYQSQQRSVLSIVERDSAHFKLTPLANWSAEDIKSYHQQHELPSHPLLSKGYASIGCYPCTSRIEEGDSERSGRWPGMDKTECGIHR
ncbi:MAG: phosphoadenylyl-sulfate reductase [Pseudomonadota bacterium]